MESNYRNVTVTWKSRGAAGWNRLSVPRWAVLFLGGLLLGSSVSAIVLGAVATRLYRDSAALTLRAEQLGQERAKLNDRAADVEREKAALSVKAVDLETERQTLAQRLEVVEAEYTEAREALARVRAEETKIRSWLGLEQEEVEEPAAGVEAAGGKGSLGDIDLDSVAPSDRVADAEQVARAGEVSIGPEARSLIADLSELASRVRERKKRWDSIPAISPVDGEHWISSSFGWRRSPFTGKRQFHNGIDMAGRPGTPILATADGVVSRVVRNPALGRAITLDHGNGIRTTYGHLDKVLAKKGKRVERGEEIGLMGSSGKRSTGPHLHYAVKLDGKYVNPWNYMLDRGRLPYPVAKK
jgi:murein DD-endopeptidase MepM/ murein hydrolase activator NlpD